MGDCDIDGMPIGAGGWDKGQVLHNSPQQSRNSGEKLRPFRGTGSGRQRFILLLAFMLKEIDDWLTTWRLNCKHYGVGGLNTSTCEAWHRAESAPWEPQSARQARRTDTPPDGNKLGVEALGDLKRMI